MFIVRFIALLTVLALSTGCASGLNSMQKSEMRHFEARNMTVKEKSPGAGAALGLLPGGGSFYGREYGFGVVNLLLWPLSILWDPVSGYDAAQVINYEATKAHLMQSQEKDMRVLDDQLSSGEIDMVSYTIQKRKVEAKYRYN